MDYQFISIHKCQANDVPICLMYGKEDPWVKPVWGLQMKRQLLEAPYYEISPAGHCPHDEVPEDFFRLCMRGLEPCNPSAESTQEEDLSYLIYIPTTLFIQFITLQEIRVLATFF
ncbi:hypothetical protein CsSME_00044018 [Camellia sinensis var. sinensis]